MNDFNLSASHGTMSLSTGWTNDASNLHSHLLEENVVITYTPHSSFLNTPYYILGYFINH
mgnify:CR=1 FL=1